MKCQLGELNERYDIVCTVGSGAYGEVQKCVEKKSGALVALKRIFIQGQYSGFPLSSLREIRLLTHLDHDNIVKLVDVFRTSNDQNVYLAFEFCEFDLQGLLHLKDAPSLTPLQVACYTRQILAGLCALQVRNIVHRDLKPANLFLTRGNVLKIGDFGLARQIDPTTHARYSPHVITLFYRPPELLLKCTKYGFEVDIWSVGCIIYEMIVREPLFRAKRDSDGAQLAAIFEICGTPTEENFPQFESLNRSIIQIVQQNPSRLNEVLQSKLTGEFEPFIDLLSQMLVLDPTKRISAEDAYKHPALIAYGRRAEPSRLPPLNLPEMHQRDVYKEKTANKPNEQK